MATVQAAENINDVPMTDAERADDGERYYGDRDLIKALFVKSMGGLTFQAVLSLPWANISIW